MYYYSTFHFILLFQLLGGKNRTTCLQKWNDGNYDSCNNYTVSTQLLFVAKIFEYSGKESGIWRYLLWAFGILPVGVVCVARAVEHNFSNFRTSLLLYDGEKASIKSNSATMMPCL